MELRDLLVTPIVIALIFLSAYLVRPFVTDPINRQYFIPGLTARILGALALGFIYQFYYHGGDTFNFHTHGSRHIYEAFWDSPTKGLKLLFSDGTYERETFRYASRIPFFTDKSSYTVIRFAAFFDLFTFSSYSATALCFALISFAGSWCLFLTFYSIMNRELHRYIAIATLFMPSVFFWGSGLMKDTLTLACIGIATYLIKSIFLDKNFTVLRMIFLAGALYVIYVTKIYILLCFLPAAIFWVFMYHLKTIRSRVLQIMILPLGIIITFLAGYFSVTKVGEGDQRYKLDMLAQTARITAYDIAFQTGRDAGSTYALGELDGTFTGMITLAPKAVNVVLFRPYLWEVRNPLMLMTAVESLLILIVFLIVIFKGIRYLPECLSNPHVVFCLMFSLTFAFAVGVSTFNFGSLSRYKIPVIPFFLLAMLFIYQRVKSAKKFSALELTE